MKKTKLAGFKFGLLFATWATLSAVSPARAEGPVPTLFWGILQLSSPADCPAFGISKGDQLNLDAQLDRLAISKTTGTWPNFTYPSLLSFSIPSQGNYVFDDPEFPVSNEFHGGGLGITETDEGGLKLTRHGAECVLDGFHFGG